MKLRGGELLSVSIEDEEQGEWQAEDIPLDIIYEDEVLIVLNKPEGLLSVPGKEISDSVYTRIKQLFPSCTSCLKMKTKFLLSMLKNIMMV